MVTDYNWPYCDDNFANKTILNPYIVYLKLMCNYVIYT